MAIRYLILVLTTRCNLRCRYCYSGDVARSAEMSATVMGQAMALAGTDGSSFHLQLTGGEPTLVPSLIEMSAALARGTGRCRSIGIQTNGTCLTQELLRTFEQYDIQVGVSLDGPPQIHQYQRGMAAETLRGLQLLESARIPFRVTTVVTQANAASLDRLVLLLAGHSMARGIGLDLLLRKGRAKNGAGVAPADRWALEKGLQRMRATLAAINARRAVPLQWREWELLFPADGRRAGVPAFCHACLGQSMAVTPDGRIFPCGQTLEDSRFAAGTVLRPQIENMQQLKRYHAPGAVCASCELSGICPGDCPSRIHYNRYLNPTSACDLYRALYRMGGSFSR